MSKRALHLLTATALVSAVSFTAFAGNPFAQKADTNKDGLIQPSEFTALGNQKFSEMDANADGLVTQAERKTYREQMRGTRAHKRFAKIDSNGDGFVSEAEFMSARSEHKQRKQEKKSRKKMHKQYMGQHMGKRSNMDINGDGAVDLAEHQVAIQARFERMDKNGDGVLGADEQKPPHGRRGKHGQN